MGRGISDLLVRAHCSGWSSLTLGRAQVLVATEAHARIERTERRYPPDHIHGTHQSVHLRSNGLPGSRNIRFHVSGQEAHGSSASSPVYHHPLKKSNWGGGHPLGSIPDSQVAPFVQSLLLVFWGKVHGKKAIATGDPGFLFYGED